MLQWPPRATIDCALNGHRDKPVMTSWRVSMSLVMAAAGLAMAAGFGGDAELAVDRSERA